MCSLSCVHLIVDSTINTKGPQSNRRRYKVQGINTSFHILIHVRNLTEGGTKTMNNIEFSIHVRNLTEGGTKTMNNIEFSIHVRNLTEGGTKFLN